MLWFLWNCSRQSFFLRLEFRKKKYICSFSNNFVTVAINRKTWITVLLAESFYDVRYWNINDHVKCLSENSWSVVHCFFSNIWNLSQINVFKTKCKLNFPQLFFWETIFEIRKHQCLYFMFSLLKFIWRTFDVIIDISV